MLSILRTFQYLQRLYIIDFLPEDVNTIKNGATFELYAVYFALKNALLLHINVFK